MPRAVSVPRDVLAAPACGVAAASSRLLRGRATAHGYSTVQAEAKRLYYAALVARQRARTGAKAERHPRRRFLTGCKFSVAQIRRASAQREGDRIRGARCAKKNAGDSAPA